MKELEIMYVEKPTFTFKGYKVIILDTVSFQLRNSLIRLRDILVECHDNRIALQRFVSHIAVDLLLPVQVVSTLNFFND